MHKVSGMIHTTVVATVSTAIILWISGNALMQASQDGTSSATGVVFEDTNHNGIRDEGERGIPKVRVSNGEQIVLTDANGRFQLPVTDDTILFVIKPRNMMTPLTANNLPRFYYIHKPNGSPKLKYGGVDPTGPLPASVDFPLVSRPEPDKFRTLMFGDPQPRNVQEVNYIAHDVVREVVGTDASFGVTLGDIVFDDLNVFHPMNDVIGTIGIPWHNVIGNHDINFDAYDDVHSDETFERVYGPSYYSYDVGPVHFIVVDDIMWTGARDDKKGFYRGGLGERQLNFIRNDLALLPKEQLVVLMMHIPLDELAELPQLFEVLSHHPHTFSVSAHQHIQRHVFFDTGAGWRGPKPHHHLVNNTVSGSWWSGSPDETGIPHTIMRDGAPNGYSIVTFDGHEYKVEFRPARRSADHQMSIYAPSEVPTSEAGQTNVYVNVFAGSSRSTVEMSLDKGSNWVALQQVSEVDPYFADLKKLEEADKPPHGRKLPNPVASTHLWKGRLPENLSAGGHLIQIRTTDIFGQTYTDHRVIRVTTD